MMSTPSSNIRVFVQWTEQTVFAGEDIECEITFKNVATTPTPSRTSLHPSSAASNGFAHGGERQRKPTAVHANNGSAGLRPHPSRSERGHKTSLSLNGPPASVRSQRPLDSWGGPPVSGGRKGKGGHSRSVSIISIGTSDNGTIGDGASGTFPERPRVTRGHGRSSSLHIVPRRQGINGGPPSGKFPSSRRRNCED